MKILLTDKIDDVCYHILEKSKDLIIKRIDKINSKDLIQTIKPYECILLRSATKITDNILVNSPNLNIIGRAGTGVDNIDVKSATKCGIFVLNTPQGNSISACELACTFILALSRNITSAHNSLQAFRWDRNNYMGNELYGKTLAIIGLGRIGREVAMRMRAFGMKIIGYDPLVTPEMANEWDIIWLELQEIWPLADYITVHVPLIPPTKYLINAKTLNQCKSGVRIINCARGGIINELDLLHALESGLCGGAALDVFEQEPIKFDDPKYEYYKRLVKHENVIVTPHLGASTYEAQIRVAEEIANNILTLNEFLKDLASNVLSAEIREQMNQIIPSLINAPCIKYLLLEEGIKWLTLAHFMGRMCIHLIHNSPLLSSKSDIDSDDLINNHCIQLNIGENIKALQTPVLHFFKTGFMQELLKHYAEDFIDSENPINRINFINGAVCYDEKFSDISVNSDSISLTQLFSASEKPTKYINISLGEKFSLTMTTKDTIGDQLSLSSYSIIELCGQLVAYDSTLTQNEKSIYQNLSLSSENIGTNISGNNNEPTSKQKNEKRLIIHKMEQTNVKKNSHSQYYLLDDMTDISGMQILAKDVFTYGDWKGHIISID